MGRPNGPVLGFDTSAGHCVAAIVDGAGVHAAHHEVRERGQAERLFGLLEEVLEAAGLRWRDLAGLGVGTGPGNFTGIRISVAAARGLGLALGIPIVGVSRLEALALDRPRPCVSLVDGRRGALYAQGFTDAGPMSPMLLDGPDPDPAGLPRTALCIGAGATGIAGRLDGRAVPPRHPLAVAIAHLAAARMAGPHAPERPRPMYLRPPDAAPASA